MFFKKKKKKEFPTALWVHILGVLRLADLHVSNVLSQLIPFIELGILELILTFTLRVSLS